MTPLRNRIRIVAALAVIVVAGRSPAAQLEPLFPADAQGYVAERAIATSPLPLFLHRSNPPGHVVLEAGGWAEFYDTEPRYRRTFSGQSAGVAAVPWFAADAGVAPRVSVGAGGGYHPMTGSLFGHLRATAEILRGDIESDGLLLSIVGRTEQGEHLDLWGAMAQIVWSRELTRELIIDRTVRWVQFLHVYLEAGYLFPSGPEIRGLSGTELESQLVTPRFGLGWMHMFGDTGGRVYFDGAPSIGRAIVDDTGDTAVVNNFRVGLSIRRILSF